MKNIFVIVFIAILASCSSTSEKPDKRLSELDKEFDWVENNDFLSEKEIPFDSLEDEFIGEESNHDSLAKESIARLPKPKLMIVEKKGETISKVVSLCYQRRFDEAFQVFDKNYRKYKKHPSYWNQVGTCYLIKGERRKALLFYNKSRDLKGKFAPPINNLGVLYLREGQDQKALAAFKKAAEVKSFSLTPIFNISQLYLKYGLVKKARELLAALYRENSTDQDVLSSLGTTYLIEGNVKKAAAFFGKMKSQYYTHPKVGINFAVALKLSGRPNDAKTILSNIDQSKLSGLDDYYSKARKFVGL